MPRTMRPCAANRLAHAVMRGRRAARLRSAARGLRLHLGAPASGAGSGRRAVWCAFRRPEPGRSGRPRVPTSAPCPMTRPPQGGERCTGPALEAMQQLVRWLIPTVDRFPRRQKFLLGDRIRTTALAGLEMLVEATFTRNRGRLLDRVNVDLDKLRPLLCLAKEPGYLDFRRYEHAARRLDEVGRLVGGWCTLTR